MIYMDDLLLAAPSIAERDEFFLKVQEALRLYNLQIAPEKIQKDFPISYLGTVLDWEIPIGYARYLGFLLINYDICFLL